METSFRHTLNEMQLQISKTIPNVYVFNTSLPNTQEDMCTLYTFTYLTVEYNEVFRLQQKNWTVDLNIYIAILLHETQKSSLHFQQFK
jgi:hypothetical protein